MTLKDNFQLHFNGLLTILKISANPSIKQTIGQKINILTGAETIGRFDIFVKTSFTLTPPPHGYIFKSSWHPQSSIQFLPQFIILDVSRETQIYMQVGRKRVMGKGWGQQGKKIPMEATVEHL